VKNKLQNIVHVYLERNWRVSFVLAKSGMVRKSKRGEKKNAYTVVFKFSFCVFKFYQVIKLRRLYETGAIRLAGVLVSYWLASFLRRFSSSRSHIWKRREICRTSLNFYLGTSQHVSTIL
jgi:hypothetical protein